jgi:hypothetical protein
MGRKNGQSHIERHRAACGLVDTYVTDAVYESVAVREIDRCLARHRADDWGNVCPVYRQRNDEAFINGDRTFSAYRLSRGREVLVITNADYDDERTPNTNVYLADEY